jgi:hypothetical protein
LVKNLVVGGINNMAEYNSEVILDSIIQGERITCFRVTYPRIVHSEFLRHRGSFCSASSRAIPLSRMIEQYFGYIPGWFCYPGWYV